MTTALSAALMAFRSLMATTLMALTSLMAALLTTTCLHSPKSRNFNYVVVTNFSHFPNC